MSNQNAKVWETKRVRFATQSFFGQRGGNGTNATGP